MYATVNNAVYKVRFATRQAVYERDVDALFQTLDEFDLRFDAVYQIHFKCSVHKLAEYQTCGPTLGTYRWSGVADTVD